MVITINLPEREYDITVKRGALSEASKLFNLNRKVLIVTDSGVPDEYSEIVAKQCKTPVKAVFDCGEESKNLETFTMLLETMSLNSFTRNDCVVAVGGGVVGDISGFAAACYMRGIDFYNIPTTLLSQVDSSIGGKTAIDFMGYKNIVGAFYQPKGVIIDADVLDTLPERQFSSGLAEAIKMAATSDEALFEMIETENAKEHIEEIIIGALNIKKYVVEQDEREAGLRKVLNFGHTVAHAIESVNGFSLFHGECVGIGMLYMCSKSVKERLEKVLKINGLPLACDCSAEALAEALTHDKKATDKGVFVVYVDKIGQFEFIELTFDKLLDVLRKGWER